MSEGPDGPGARRTGVADRYWTWIAGLPPWAALAAALVVWGATLALCWMARTLSLSLSLISAGVAQGAWWAWNLVLVGLAVALVPRARSWGDRVAGPVLYGIAFGPPGAAAYVAVRGAGIFRPSRLTEAARAVAEWLPDRARELFGRAAEEPARQGPSRRVCALVLAGVAAIAVALYWPILGAGLKKTVTREDISYFQAAKELGFWRWSEYFSCQFFLRYTIYPGAWFRPLQPMSYALDYEIWGDRIYGWHLTSLLLHLGTVGLFFWAVTLTTRDRMAGVVAASLYAVMPTNGGAVGWIAARVDPLTAFFTLGAMVCFGLLFAGKSRWLFPAGMVLFGLALGSKEVAVVAGGVIAAWAALIARGPRWLRWGVAATLGVSLLVYGVSRVVTGTIYVPPRYIYTGWQPHSLRWFLEGLWPPVPQIASALQMRSVSFPGEHLAVLAAALGLLRRNWRPAVVWFAWKAALLAPNMGFSAISHYRDYLPNLGTAALSGIMASEALATMRTWPRPLRWIPIAVAAVFFVIFAWGLPAAVADWAK